MNKSLTLHLAIADDHPLIRKGVIDLLSDIDKFKVTIEAPNGKELLRQIEQSKQTIDMVLLDINMPELNGYETIKLLNEQWPKIKVVVLSMFSNEFAITQMLNSGARGYISKSSLETELLDALQQVADKGFYFSQTMAEALPNGLYINTLKNLLNDKELHFLKYCTEDISYSEIADKMKTSARSIEAIREKMFKTFNLKSRAGLTAFAINNGLQDVVN